MKASLEWLKDFSEITVSGKELGDILTMTGSKLETIEERGKDIKNVVVGKILEIEKHPNADKLIVTKVDVGSEVIQIVTGADNVKPGDIVPIAKNGSSLPGGVNIKKGELRGIESNGMMCSCGELNIPIDRFPNQIEHGIMILPSEMENKLGENIVDVLQLEEEILDFEITSNRPDCFSIEGLGRETAVSLNTEFKNPRKDLEQMNVGNKEEIEGLKVDITAPDLCYRYMARIVKDVKVGESPDWMKRRLEACGIRSINNIVDITNYVMLELGQPMHAFDINAISGKHITVRRAKDGEEITTLDEEQRSLNHEMLVISDDEKALAIAGVMGAQNSEIEKETTTVVFESAVFNGGNVRKTAKKVGLRTEASSRYEKGLPAENAERAINRAVQLVEFIGAGKAVQGKIDVYPTKQKLNKVEFNPEKINRLLGTNISREEMVKTLEKLEMKVEGDVVIPPYFRVDIERLADLAEEIVRFYGYDKIDCTLIHAEATLGIRTKTQKLTDKIRQTLVSKGLCEIYTYGFMSPKELDKMEIAEDSDLRMQVISVKNPLSEEYSIMRTTTLPSMLQTIVTNQFKKNKNVGLFDISRVYRNVDGKVEQSDVPTEDTIVTIGMYGENVDFYIVKGLIEKILTVSSVLHYDVVSEKCNNSYHPGKTANIKVGKDIVATLGEIHPAVAENYGVKGEVYVAEIWLSKLVKYGKMNKKYTEVAKFPAVERDIAMLIDENIEVGNIEKVIQKKGKKILEEITLFDVYRNEKLGENKKSVAYSLKFRSKDRTLTDDEINEAMEEIVKELENSLGAELRK